MNIIIQSQLDRVNTALTTLIDSITSYNPSVTAATNLLAADDQLQKGLIQLARHQKNQARILALHEKISNQNSQIISTLTDLADARTDLLSIPVSLPAQDAQEVPYTDLLDYAKRISRNTIPLTSRLIPVSPPPLTDAQPSASEASTVNGSTEALPKATEQGPGIGTETLPIEDRKWLDELLLVPFVPWVNDDAMRRGALTLIQAMVERGEDPTAVEGKDVKGSGKKDEGMEDVRDEATEVREDTRRREGQIKRQEQPKVFEGLDLYDPDDIE